MSLRRRNSSRNAEAMETGNGPAERPEKPKPHHAKRAGPPRHAALGPLTHMEAVPTHGLPEYIERIPETLRERLQVRHQIFYGLAVRSAIGAPPPEDGSGEPPSYEELRRLPDYLAQEAAPVSISFSDTGAGNKALDGTATGFGTGGAPPVDEARDDAMPEGSPRLIFHPMHPLKIKWDLWIGALILFSCISVPFLIGFDIQTSAALVAVNSFVDVMFFCDITLSFRTAYENDDGVIVSSPRRIAARYLKGWFFIDVITTVPFDQIFALALSGQGSVLRSTKLLRIMRLLRLARLLKLSSKTKGSEDDVEEWVNPSLQGLGKMFGSIVFIAHLLGCFWHWMAVLHSDSINWMSFYGIQDNTLGMRYLASLYWAFTTMTTVGYGDIVPTSSLERGFCIVSMLIGASVFGYIIGNVTVIVESFDVQEALRSEKLAHTNEWIKEHQLPTALAKRVRKQVKYSLKHSGVFDNSDILGAMPGVTAISMVYAQYSRLINRSSMLRTQPPPLVAQLMSAFRTCFATPGDAIYLERDVGTHWYVMWGGGEVNFYVTVTAEAAAAAAAAEIADGHFGGGSYGNGSAAGGGGGGPWQQGSRRGRSSKQAGGGSGSVAAIPPQDATAAAASLPGVDEIVRMGVLKEDAQFGSDAVILDVLHGASAMAHTHCDLLTLQKEAFSEVLAQWPQLARELRARARAWCAQIEDFRRAAAVEIFAGRPPPPPLPSLVGSRPPGEVDDGEDNGNNVNGSGSASRARSCQSPCPARSSSPGPRTNDATPPLSPAIGEIGRPEHVRRGGPSRSPPGIDVQGSAEEGPSPGPLARKHDEEDGRQVQDDSNTPNGEAWQTPDGAKMSPVRRASLWLGNKVPSRLATGSSGRQRSASVAAMLRTGSVNVSKASKIPPNQLVCYAGIIHPEASYKMSWDVFLSMLILWSVIETTYRMGFARREEGAWVGWNAFITAAFAVDIVLSFLTAYWTDEPALIIDRKQVAKHYLKGWFLVDVLSTFPFDAVLTIFVDDAAAASLIKLLRAVRLVRLFKLARLLRMSAFFDEHEDDMPMGRNGAQMLRMLCLMVFSAHLTACAWFASGLHPATHEQPTSWIEKYCQDDGLNGMHCIAEAGPAAKYLASIYYVFTTFTTVGYGDITPSRNSAFELVLASVVEVLGATIFAYVIGNIVAIITNLDPAERTRKNLIGYLKEYLRDVPLTLTQKRAVKRHYDFHLGLKSVFDENSLLHQLAPHVRRPVEVFLSRKLLPQLPFVCALEDQVPGTMSLVMPQLRPALYRRGERIVIPQIVTREMTFVCDGPVEARVSGGTRTHHVRTYNGGDHFAEALILLPESVPLRIVAQVAACGSVEVMHYDRASFGALRERYPHVADYMAKQLYHPVKTFQWVVVPADSEGEKAAVARIAALTRREIVAAPPGDVEDAREEESLAAAAAAADAAADRELEVNGLSASVQIAWDDEDDAVNAGEAGARAATPGAGATVASGGG